MLDVGERYRDEILFSIREYTSWKIKDSCASLQMRAFMVVGMLLWKYVLFAQYNEVYYSKYQVQKPNLKG